MDMQMRHALADAIVYGDERAFGLHPLLHRVRQPLHIAEERADQFFGQVRQGFVMFFGDKQRVAQEQRPMIQEG